jgi:hypothetical protein
MKRAKRIPTRPQTKENDMDVASIVGQVIVALFMLFFGYGAFLLVSDSEKRWKERYGNRWFVTPSEREKLDKAYAERQTTRKATRRVNLSKFTDNRSE